MAFTYGFYNAIEEDKLYNAIQVSQIFDGIIKDGVYMHVGDRLIVKKFDGDNSVLVSSGRAWFNHTWNYNDTELLVVGEPSELILNRIDAVVIDIWAADSVRENSIKWVTGAPASSPIRPTLIKDDYNRHWQYPLAYIYRTARATKISQADITNMVGTSECPFVTGVLQTMDIDSLVLQWKAQWANFVRNYEDSAIKWRDDQRRIFLTWIDNQKEEYEAWTTGSTAQWSQWFDRIKDFVESLENGEAVLRLEALFDEIFNLATEADIEAIVGNVYIERPETGTIFDITTEADIESIVGDSYVEEDDEGDWPIEDEITDEEMSEIVNNAFPQGRKAI